MWKCHKLHKNSVKRSRKRSLAIFSYKKIKQKIAKTENLISQRIQKYINLQDPHIFGASSITPRHGHLRSSQWSKPQKLQRSPFEWTTNSLFKYPLRNIEWEAAAVTAALPAMLLLLWIRLLFIHKTQLQLVYFRPQALSSLFSNCHVNDVQIFMSHKSTGFQWTFLNYFSILIFKWENWRSGDAAGVTFELRKKLSKVCKLSSCSTNQIIWNILTRIVIGLF